MSEIIEVKIKVRNTHDIDIAGMGGFQEFKDFIEEYYDTDKWKVVGIPKQWEWLTYEGSPGPETWDWAWIEYFSKACTVPIEAAEAARVLSITPDNIEEAYQGEFDSDAQFAQERAYALEDMGNVQWPFTCIDWEYAARELRGDCWSEDGHYFQVL